MSSPFIHSEYSILSILRQKVKQVILFANFLKISVKFKFSDYGNKINCELKKKNACYVFKSPTPFFLPPKNK